MLTMTRPRTGAAHARAWRDEAGAHWQLELSYCPEREAWLASLWVEPAPGRGRFLVHQEPQSASLDALLAWLDRTDPIAFQILEPPYDDDHAV